MVRARNKSWKSAAARRLIDLVGGPDDIDGAIRLLVEQVVAQVDAIPVDLEKLAAQFRIRALNAADLPYSGELRKTKGGYEIYYASHLSNERKRFTIAHEIGHAILASSGKGAPRHGAELERICDKLAAEILMPTRHFRENCSPASPLTRILQLSKLYRTSLTSTAIRFAELFRATVFEVNQGSITWSYGVIRKGPLTEKDPTLRATIDRLMAKRSNAELLPYTTRHWGGQWLLEVHHIGPDRGLFLFRPHRNDVVQMPHSWVGDFENS